MTWTYTGNPWTFPVATQQNLIDTVRFLIGDTDTTDQQLQDGEITGVLNQNGATTLTVTSTTTSPVYFAAIEACRAIMGKVARQVDKGVGDFHLSASQRLKAYQLLIKDLERQSLRHIAVTPYVGGISSSDMQIDQTDDDLIQHQFSIGQMDDQGTSPDFGGTTTFTGAAP